MVLCWPVLYTSLCSELGAGVDRAGGHHSVGEGDGVGGCGGGAPGGMEMAGRELC